MSVENRRPREYDDDDDLDIRKPEKGNGKWLMWLAIVAVGIVLVAGVTGGAILIVRSAAGDATAAKLPGSWKGQFAFPGQPPIDAVYVFERGGGFRQESLTALGQVEVVRGRWRVSLGEIVIDWDNGAIERATVTWTNDQTMEYKIVEHDDVVQIGSVTTMRRQAVPKRR
jgi:hypothetical protein